jgi:ABC-type microcin C transport system duplicated ATPase subunit YejF
LESALIQKVVPTAELKERLLKSWKPWDLSRDQMNRYPHEFSEVKTSESALPEQFLEAGVNHRR